MCPLVSPIIMQSYNVVGKSGFDITILLLGKMTKWIKTTRLQQHAHLSYFSFWFSEPYPRILQSHYENRCICIRICLLYIYYVLDFKKTLTKIGGNLWGSLCWAKKGFGQVRLFWNQHHYPFEPFCPQPYSTTCLFILPFA